MAKISYEKYFSISEITDQIKSYLKDFDVKKFLNAFEFAEAAHRGQLRKDGKTPYIAHPAEVVKILISIHADEETLISALLHDVPEDTERTIEEVKAAFGDKVSFLVDGVTKLSKVHYQNDMPQHQVESLRKLFLHSGEDLRVIVIKLADRLHNMRTMGNISDEKKRLRISRETLEIYVPIANLLGIQDIKSKLEDLCFKYIFPAEYETLHKNRKKSDALREKLSKNFSDSIMQCCKENNIEARVSRKNKSLYSIYKKISAVGKSVNDLDDRIAIKIIVKDIKDCYHVLGVIHSNFVPINDRFRDYIANPKSNGYQSLHTTVFGVDGVMTEVQIKTEKMAFDADYGIAANFFEDNNPATDEKRSKWVNKILEIEKHQKTNEDFLQNIKADVFEDRIFVFSPKGMPVDLPKGATALDFAYSIHSDIGNHAIKADISGKIKPISTTLRTGDVVRILLSKKTTPELSWLSLVKTNAARSKILEYFKTVNKSKKISEGLKLLQKEFDIAGLGLVDNINYKKLLSKIQNVTDKVYQNRQELFAAISEGEIRTTDIAKYVEGSVFKKFDGHPVRIDLRIVAKNKFGLLRDISEILYKNVLDMYSLKGWASKHEEEAFFSAEILVPDLETVSHIFDELEQVEGVTGVYRLSSKGIVLFGLAAILTAAFWISHGYIIKLISLSHFGIDHQTIADFITYFVLILLIVAVLFMRNLTQKYFPLMRKRKLLWTTTFLIPIAATGVLFVETFYFDLQLSWIITLVEVCFIYAYLLISYVHYTKTMK
jgi:GTP pyrophosphokinase